MSGIGDTPRLATFLVRRRTALMVLTAVLAVLSVWAIPRVRINSDVTTYLPADSPMRVGLSIVAEHLPGLDIRRQILRLEFPEEEPSDTLQAAIESLLTDPQLPDIRSSGDAAYYQYSLPRDTDNAALKAAVRARFGDRVSLEIEDNTGMPEGVPRMIAIGFALIFLILLVMSPSLVEALLYMLTIGIAILINMGTNVLLPSVSMITNALSTVLQMALSLDYAIILSNRFRQAQNAVPEGSAGPVILSESEESPSLRAMAAAIGKAAPSILSSALTTVASLLMLCFMRLRFGLDFGVVLSKGVLCSLLCSFTLLPGLLLLCSKAISRTEKRVPLVPTDGLARFEYRFRVPVLVVFVALLAGSYFLQRRVPVYYSMNRTTEMMRRFPPKNTMLLVYPTAEEEALLPLLDALRIADADLGQRTDSASFVRSPYAETGAMHENVQKCALSYPSIALKPRTAGEWRAMLASLPGSPALDSDSFQATGIPEEALDLLFYAATHPDRNERFALNELRMPPGVKNPLQSGWEFSGNDGKVVSGDDTSPFQGADASFQGSSPEAPEGSAAPDPRNKSGDDGKVVSGDDGKVMSGDDGNGILNDTSTVILSDTSAVILSDSEESPYTYEGLHQKRTVAGMHAYLGVEMRALRIAYRMAGHGKDPAARMSALEVMDVVQTRILGNRLYAAMIPKAQRAELAQMKRDFDATLAAGPADPRNKSGDDGKVVSGDDGKVVSGVDGKVVSGDDEKGKSGADESVVSEDDGKVVSGDDGNGILSDTSAVILSDSEESPPDPLEDLAVLALSRKKCSATKCYRALHRAGVKVTPEEIDLLYLYNGYLTAADTTARLSLVEMLSCLDTLSRHPMASAVIDSARRAELTALRTQLDARLGLLRSPEWSAAVLQSDLPEEASETYAFIDALRRECAERFSGETYVAGYSVMYDEMRGSFPGELLLVTLLTALMIFAIVALTFKSLLIPVILVSIVMTAVWLDVFLSGLGGNAILFMAYFIVQSILMGATIDYSILFTHYYRESRRTLDAVSSLQAAYRGSIHTIATSGLILTLGTWAMTLVISDPVIVPVLRSIASGSLIAILLILLVLPALLTLLVRQQKKRHSSEG